MYEVIKKFDVMDLLHGINVTKEEFKEIYMECFNKKTFHSTFKYMSDLDDIRSLKPHYPHLEKQRFIQQKSNDPKLHRGDKLRISGFGECLWTIMDTFDKYILVQVASNSVYSIGSHDVLVFPKGIRLSELNDLTKQTWKLVNGKEVCAKKS